MARWLLTFAIGIRPIHVKARGNYHLLGLILLTYTSVHFAHTYIHNRCNISYLEPPVAEGPDSGFFLESGGVLTPPWGANSSP